MQTLHHANLIPIDAEPRATLDTATAALHLNRRPQTLRVWACHETGPIKPLRISGRLAWPVAGIRGLLFGTSAASEHGAQLLT